MQMKSFELSALLVCFGWTMGTKERGQRKDVNNMQLFIRLEGLVLIPRQLPGRPQGHPCTATPMIENLPNRSVNLCKQLGCNQKSWTHYSIQDHQLLRY